MFSYTQSIRRCHSRASRVAVLGFACALVTAGSGAVATAPPGSSAVQPTNSQATVAVGCHGRVPDQRYRQEVESLGASHACEHLTARQEGRTQSHSTHHDVDPPDAGPRLKSNAEGAASDDPALVGSWSAASNPGTKTIGISSVLLHTGKVLLFGGKYSATDKNTAAYLYDPVTRTGHEVPAPAAVFCGSVTQLSDGRVLSAGGADPIPKGIVDLWLFDPSLRAMAQTAGHTTGSLLPHLHQARRRARGGDGRRAARRYDPESDR